MEGELVSREVARLLSAHVPGYVDPVSEFLDWSAVLDTLECMSSTMAQVSAAISEVEAHADTTRFPEDLGLVIAVDGDIVLMGWDTHGVRIDRNGMVEVVYSR